MSPRFALPVAKNDNRPTDDFVPVIPRRRFGNNDFALFPGSFYFATPKYVRGDYRSPITDVRDA